MLKAIKFDNASDDSFHLALSSALQSEIPSLKKHNNIFTTIITISPLLGLLGTVIGMIETFQAITLFGTGDPKQMAGGISQALVTTMLGLIVAAPLLGFYTYISDRVNTLIQVVEEKGSYLLSKE